MGDQHGQVLLRLLLVVQVERVEIQGSGIGSLRMDRLPGQGARLARHRVHIGLVPVFDGPFTALPEQGGFRMAADGVGHGRRHFHHADVDGVVQQVRRSAAVQGKMVG